MTVRFHLFMWLAHWSEMLDTKDARRFGAGVTYYYIKDEREYKNSSVLMIDGSSAIASTTGLRLSRCKLT